MARLSGLYPRGPIDVSSWLQPLREDGSVPPLPGWRWIHTPGHTVGHVAFWREADRALIAGDAFITTDQESAYAVATQKPELQGPPMYFTPHSGRPQSNAGGHRPRPGNSRPGIDRRASRIGGPLRQDRGARPGTVCSRRLIRFAGRLHQPCSGGGALWATEVHAEHHDVLRGARPGEPGATELGPHSSLSNTSAMRWNLSTLSTIERLNAVPGCASGSQWLRSRLCLNSCRRSVWRSSMAVRIGPVASSQPQRCRTPCKTRN
jgi:hypothetical protein